MQMRANFAKSRHVSGYLETALEFGHVCMAELKEDIEEGFKYFCANRPNWNPDMPEHSRPVVKKYVDPVALAKHYLSIDHPRRGSLKLMCESSGLKYTQVTSLCSKLRKSAAAA